MWLASWILWIRTRASYVFPNRSIGVQLARMDDNEANSSRWSPAHSVVFLTRFSKHLSELRVEVFQHLGPTHRTMNALGLLTTATLLLRRYRQERELIKQRSRSETKASDLIDLDKDMS